MRAIVTGGGTGGHIYPALAVVEALRRCYPEADVRYVGGRSGMESTIVPAAGVPYHAVTTRKLRRVASPSTALVLLSLLRGYREAGAYMRDFGPDVVVSTGGYVAAATALAAARQGRPTLIQEFNAVPGRTNVWLSRWATRICVWFEETAARFPGAQTAMTGVPIRPEVVGTSTKAEARRELGLEAHVFTLFVYGGSQGAMRLNEIVLGALPLLGAPLQVLHQTGERNYDSVVEAAADLHLVPGVKHSPLAYLDADQARSAYRAADLVVCRCGVSTLAEVTANGAPALMVPLPTAYADHQTANARAVERAGAGVHAPQAGLTPGALAQQVEALRARPDRLAAMAEASRALGRRDAADRVADLAASLARTGGTAAGRRD